MLNTTVNIYAYHRETKLRIGSHPIHSRSFAGVVPVPTKNDFVAYQTWRLPVFDVLFTYLNDTTRVDLSVWVDDVEVLNAINDIR
jgi:hypothetical protein